MNTNTDILLKVRNLNPHVVSAQMVRVLHLLLPKASESLRLCNTFDYSGNTSGHRPESLHSRYHKTLTRKTTLSLNNKQELCAQSLGGWSKRKASEWSYKGLSKKESKEIVTGKRRKVHFSPLYLELTTKKDQTSLAN